ncbi:MAG TPA: PQQ-binding-like beta-propeller repeat protein, partial [Candidatus Binatia bacterium]|nr:PQQ-binding-like beta-propeller repeat protein [Candidatus Binatia bacterium]
MTLRSVAVVLAVLAGGAADGRPMPCPDGRFRVVDGTRLLDLGAAPLTEVVVVENGTVALTSGCVPAAAVVSASRRRTTLRVRWPDCAGRKTRLRARIRAAGCDVMRGVLVARGARPRKHRFRATRVAEPPFAYDVPLDPGSPWPKFRRTSVQDGRSPILPSRLGGHLWKFQTGKGIFSSPVVGGDGTVYVGSADRTFYAIAADGSVRWQRLTGEIIDSSALLDDRGRVYFGSGDGKLYALDAATGAPAWIFGADPASVTRAFIDWFEGNVAIGADGTLYVPNDNFLTYALDRVTTAVRWRFQTADQTWSLPAVDAARGRLFIGNNSLLTILGDNTFSLDAATGATRWSTATDGSIPASPLLTPDGQIVAGGFDGFVRAYDQETGALRWSFGARDHVYASPAALPDGTIVQAAADGTVYALAPADGRVVWQFDTRDAIRSSPAVDGDGNVYVGSGEGRLFVLNPDGTLRWSIRLIDAARDDLNASPALAADAILIAGESGEVFSVPYDYCLRPEAAGDARCRVGPGEDLPADGAHLFFTTRFGRQLDEPPMVVDANQPLTFSLFVREGGDTRLALIDSPSVSVSIEPSVPARIEVSGDRKFITLVPEEPWGLPTGRRFRIDIEGRYLVDPERAGLLFTGGRVGGTFSERFQFVVQPAVGGGLPLPVPVAPGDPAGVWELSRVAQPLPTILPSYNQIGFDSLHYLIGLVEPGDGTHPIAWVVGAKLAEGQNRTVVDPSTRVLFPLEVTYDGGFLTLLNTSGFAIEFNRIRLPFTFFRIATRVDESGAALESPALNVSAVCEGISFYGVFLRRLGFCNPQTDVLITFGAAELRTFGVAEAPAGVGSVVVVPSADAVTATFSGTTLRADEHSIGLLLVNAATGKPVPLDYGFATTRETDASGVVQSVSVALPAGTPGGAVRAHV